MLQMASMFGLGKKDKDGRQVRLEHRGKHIRASRTGGIALRAEKKFGPANLTANTSKGLRVNSRIAHGLRVALQNGHFRLIGRWHAGPLGINLSKRGVSASVKNKAGTFNLLKPNYSSFKIAGLQLRGRNAANLQLVYLLFLTVVAGLRLVMFALSLLMLIVLFLWDFMVAFVNNAEDDHPLRNSPKR